MLANAWRRVFVNLLRSTDLLLFIKLGTEQGRYCSLHESVDVDPELWFDSDYFVGKTSSLHGGEEGASFLRSLPQLSLRSKSMARAYSGVLAAVAVCLAITRGLVLGMMPNEILTQVLLFFFVFALVGYCIGFIAERVVTESLETQFRSDLAALKAKVNQAPSESKE